MKIVVCVKQVPDTNEVRIDPVRGTLIREGVPSIMNPDDKNALEEALRFKDEFGAHVTVITMGPAQAENVLREAMAMGADEAVLLSDRAFSGADTWATSLTLAKAIEKLGFDIVFAGRQAIDGDTAQVGPEIAEHLGLPQVTYVEKVEVNGDELKVRRALEDGYETIKVKLPCLLTTIKELNNPRYMNMYDLFTCFGKEIKVMTANDLDVDKKELGLNGSPTRVKASFTKGAKTPGEKVELSPIESAKLIVSKLKERQLI